MEFSKRVSGDAFNQIKTQQGFPSEKAYFQFLVCIQNSTNEVDDPACSPK
jgi:hypothetical protein